MLITVGSMARLLAAPLSSPSYTRMILRPASLLQHLHVSQSSFLLGSRPLACTQAGFSSRPNTGQDSRNPLETAPTNDAESETDDHEDPSGEIAVYKGILSTQIKLVKSFSLMTSVIGMACQPVLYYKVQNGQSVGLVLATGAFISFFTFATPLLIHFVSKKYVTDLYYNSRDDSYTAVTYSLLLRRKEIKFRLGDVQVPDIPGMFTTFKARNTPLFVDGQQFYSPHHYGKIMGYDKPLNLRWRGGPEEGCTEGQAKKDQ